MRGARDDDTTPVPALQRTEGARPFGALYARDRAWYARGARDSV